jgi:hypothetical protein
MIPHRASERKKREKKKIVGPRESRGRIIIITHSTQI